jgi:copper resistance protein D
MTLAHASHKTHACILLKERGLLALAAINKLRFIPALRLGDPVAASHLSKSIYVEWLVILAILSVSAVLTTNLTLAK